MYIVIKISEVQQWARSTSDVQDFCHPQLLWEISKYVEKQNAFLLVLTYYNTEKALKTISAIMKMKSEMIVYINTYWIMKSGEENISFFVVQHPIWDGLSLFK